MLTKLNLGNAYAMTLNKSQGKTIDNTILLISKEGVMDAKSMYVGMTRHRNNVDVYYNQSDFGSFKALVNSVSKYSYKDSLVDYEHSVPLSQSDGKNPHARIIEYLGLREEIVSVLDDIRNDQADWKEYNTLKSKKIETEKEILSNYDAHKLYLDQLGITKEKLEISTGLKLRPMTKIELEARNTVITYAKTSQETRAMYESIKKGSRNITKHKEYGKYCNLREQRNSLAEKILSNQPLYKEFVSEMSREYFISFKSMRRQVDYARSSKSEMSSNFGSGIHVVDYEKNAHVSIYVGTVNLMKNLHESMSKEIGEGGNISKHRDYAKYLELAERKDKYGKMIAESIDSYEEYLKKHESQGVSRKSLEEQYGKQEDLTNKKEMQAKYNDLIASFAKSLSMENVDKRVFADRKSPENTHVVETEESKWIKALSQVSATDEETAKQKALAAPHLVSKVEQNVKDASVSQNDIFAKLEAAKDKSYSNNNATQLISESLMMDKKGHDYKENMKEHKKDFGYAQHVSKPTVYAFCEGYDVSSTLHKGESAQEYASMLVQQKLNSQGLQEATPEIVESAVKQALCFQALKNAYDINTKELTHESVQELHKKAEILANNLTSENIHVLQDKGLMKEVSEKISVSQKEELSNVYVNRIIDVNNTDIRKKSLLQKEQQHEQYQEVDKTKGCEISF